MDKYKVHFTSCPEFIRLDFYTNGRWYEDLARINKRNKAMMFNNTVTPEWLEYISKKTQQLFTEFRAESDICQRCSDLN